MFRLISLTWLIMGGIGGYWQPATSWHQSGEAYGLPNVGKGTTGLNSYPSFTYTQVEQKIGNGAVLKYLGGVIFEYIHQMLEATLKLLS